MTYEKYIVTLRRTKDRKLSYQEVIAESPEQAKDKIVLGNIDPDYVFVNAETKEHWMQKKHRRK